MNEDEILAAKCLSQPTYPVASFDKRFAANMHFQVTQSVPMISERGAAQLWRILHRYRRQISHPSRDRLLDIAEKLKAPDMRSSRYREAQEQQREIERRKYEAAFTTITMKGKTCTTHQR